LGVDTPERNVMKRPPRRTDSNILSIYSTILLLLQSLSMSILSALGLFIFYYYARYNKIRSQTVCYYILIVLCPVLFS